MNGYNFTERVRRVLASAREEAAALDHEYVGTEHILLGMLREPSGVATTVIENLGAKPDVMRELITNTIRRGTSRKNVKNDLPYTSRAKKVLELSMSEARDLGHSYVGTEHALLGLLREEKGIAAQVLIDAGITLDVARAETVRLLKDSESTEKTKPRFAQRSPAVSATSVNAHLPRSARRVRQIISAAHDVAAERKSRIVLPAHVMIALLQHGAGLANAALDRLGFDPQQGLAALNDIAPIGTDTVEPDDVLTPSPSLVTAIEAMEQGRRDGNAVSAGSQHLLLALVLTCVEIDAVFAAQDIAADDIRAEILQISG